MNRPLVVIGDALLDRDVDGTVERVCPDSPAAVLDERAAVVRPGGAALAAVLAAEGMVPVQLVTALADDEAAGELRRALDAAGVEIVDLGLAGPTPEKVRFLSLGHCLLRVDRGGDGGPVGRRRAEVGALVRAAVDGAAAVLVSDYGRGMAAHDSVRRAVASTRAPVVWDPHPRGPAPVPGARVVTPNLAELCRAHGRSVEDMAGITRAARDVLEQWGARQLAVTLGDRGALLVGPAGPPLAVPAPARHRGDTCGAGDCFAAAVGRELAAGALPSEAVVAAVEAASRFVAGGGAAALGTPPGGSPPGPRRPPSRGDHLTPGRSGEERLAGDPLEVAVRMAEEARSRGATVVATGGCFDLLHAGHVHLLHEAKALGDVLIVFLNSDASVRRLKGAHRPVVPEGDRAATVAALGCVDAVVVFDDDTPVPVLERLRPEVFVKGGDYGGRAIPEAPAMARWQGQTVVVPYLSGRSTTSLLDRVAGGASPSR